MTAREVDVDLATENVMSHTVTKNADSTSLSSDDYGTNEIKYCRRHYHGRQDTATEKAVSGKNKKFELEEIFQLLWIFRAMLAFSLFETITSMTFAPNATELAEQRFKVKPITAGWIILASKYGVFGVGLTLLLSMALADLVSSRTGSPVSLDVYSVVFNLGYTATMDGTCTNLWHQSVYSSAFSLKVTMNHAIIVRIITSALQDADNNSYLQIMQVYLVLSVFTAFVGIVILLSTFMTKQLAILQWAQKKRLTSGAETSHVLKDNSLIDHDKRARYIYIVCFAAFVLLIAYIGGAVTGHTVEQRESH
ncbi:hypothetical protein N7539_009339 [Penicillium diatomitis]|uniref:Uncharacterized protein n=1 Tax=Penicillium diatomitis TaxID=2819901 RepID=A0A9W9WLM9_9EURO|nr:uncharacterized protein N7539_009339 [Penicillium diatomitis]KAJ5469721.1 hypothetical protein N7539_009339 [Penicillium diatomitis]